MGEPGIGCGRGGIQTHPCVGMPESHVLCDSSSVSESPNKKTSPSFATSVQTALRLFPTVFWLLGIVVWNRVTVCIYSVYFLGLQLRVMQSLPLGERCVHGWRTVAEEGDIFLPDAAKTRENRTWMCGLGIMAHGCA